MSKWLIEYWSEERDSNPIEKWLDELTDDQFKSVAKELKMLAESGNKLKLPHSRALGKGLFELRERRYGYRVYYGFHGKHLIILFAAGDKTSQKRDVKRARERLSNYMGKKDEN